MFSDRGLDKMLARYARRESNRSTWRGNAKSRSPRTPRRSRPRCGAMTRKGTPCAAPVAWDKRRDRPVNGRCRCHGGASTGPRTDAGRKALIVSNRRRAVLRDLANLVPELEEGRRERWADALLMLSQGYSVTQVSVARGVARQTIYRWRRCPGFREARRRAGVRYWAWWDRDMFERHAREGAKRYGMPVSEVRFMMRYG